MFTLMALPYADNALAPVISPNTISFHYGKHHKTYLDNRDYARDAYVGQGPLKGRLLSYRALQQVPQSIGELGLRPLVDVWGNLHMCVPVVDFNRLVYGSVSKAAVDAFDRANAKIRDAMDWPHWPVQSWSAIAGLQFPCGGIASVRWAEAPSVSPFIPAANQPGPLVTNVPVKMPKEFSDELIKAGFKPYDGWGDEIYILLTIDRHTRIGYVSGVTEKKRQGPDFGAFWGRLWSAQLAGQSPRTHSRCRTCPLPLCLAASA